MRVFHPLLLRLGSVSTLVVAAALSVGPADAAPNRQQCLAAYEDAQLSMRRGRLMHARDPLGTCLEQVCPASLRTDCADWLKEVEARTPSVVIECVQDGASVRDVKLSVDGAAHPSGIDGHALDLDPGNHVFKVEPKDGPPIVIETLIKEGEKLKPIRFELPSKLPKKDSSSSSTTTLPPQEMERPVPWTVFAAGGVGALALGGFTVFAIMGSSAKSDLEPCKPDCSESQISDVRSRFITADVFLVVTALALGAATVLYLTRPSVASTTRASLPSYDFRF
jgi:hypothetical protein